MALLEFHNKGIYCPKANIYIDPWKPVGKAIITHGHSDHARRGHQHYLTHKDNENILRYRLGKDISVESKAYNAPFSINEVTFSLHPAGHIFGSSQVRVEYRGEVWVVSGDYKMQPDNVSIPFEPVKCHTFITESTFGLPVYQWKPQEEILKEIVQWYSSNRELGITSVLVGYSLGKAQRLIANLQNRVDEIFVHGAIDQINNVLNDRLPELTKTRHATQDFEKKEHRGSLVITPSPGLGTTWMRKFEPYSVGIASGWMTLRGARRRRAADRGFVLSDHADWNELNEAVNITGAENVFITHGYSLPFTKWLCDKGLNARVVETRYEGELQEEEEKNG